MLTTILCLGFFPDVSYYVCGQISPQYLRWTECAIMENCQIGRHSIWIHQNLEKTNKTCICFTQQNRTCNRRQFFAWMKNVFNLMLFMLIFFTLSVQRKISQVTFHDRDRHIFTYIQQHTFEYFYNVQKT